MRIFINICVLGAQKVICKTEKTMMTLFSTTNQERIFVGHTVEFYLNLPVITTNSTKVEGLNSYGDEEVYDLEGSEENISFDVASKLLPDCKIDHPVLVVSLYCYSLVFSQLERILTTELKKDVFVPTNEKIDDFRVKISIVESKEESP